jgi:hypothetical protein
MFLPHKFSCCSLCLNRSKAISTPDVNISTDNGVHDVSSGTTVSAINNPTFYYDFYFMPSLRTLTTVYKTFCFTQPSWTQSENSHYIWALLWPAILSVIFYDFHAHSFLLQLWFTSHLGLISWIRLYYQLLGSGSILACHFFNIIYNSITCSAD